MIRRSEEDWLPRRALARRIGNPTYRSELMYKVADGMAYASQTIVNEFPGAEKDSAGDPHTVNSSFGGLPDKLLQQAADLAAAIERPVWHDRGLAIVAGAAAESKQFSRP